MTTTSPAVLVAGLTLALAIGTPAHAEVMIFPTSSAPDALQRYSLVVPAEHRGGPLTAITVRLPADTPYALIGPSPGWSAELLRLPDDRLALRWTHGRVHPGHYAALDFLIRNRPTTGVAPFGVLVRRRSGAAEHWIGTPASPYPAADVELRRPLASTPSPEATPAATVRAQRGRRLAPTLALSALIGAGFAAAAVLLVGRSRR